MHPDRPALDRLEPRLLLAANPRLSINDATVTEGADGATTVMTFLVQRSGGRASLNRVSKVSYATSEDGTPDAATENADFDAASGVVRFRPFQVRQRVRVVINNDATEEGDETFAVTLSNPRKATLLDADAVGTIRDDDVPTLAIDDVSQAEGDAGTTTYTFTVSLSAASASTITVDYATADGSAEDENGEGDYDSATGTLTFNPAETTKTIYVTVNADTDAEADETFRVLLSDADNASISDASGLGTIEDDDTPSLSVDDVSIVEGDSGVANMTFTVTLNAASAQTVSVNYRTVNGTAIAGDDYLAKSGTLTFAPAETTKTFTVAVPGDTLVESNKQFTVLLSGAVNANIADASGTGTIFENEAVPGVSVADVSVTENDEGNKTFTVTFTLSSASDETVVARYVTIDDTALAGADYVADAGNVVFAPGQTAKNITLTIKGDTTDEPSETFNVGLTEVVNASSLDGLGVITILDNDGSPTLAISDATATEGGDLTFTVTLSEASANTVTVDYATADDSAEDENGDDDYTSDSGTLTFTPGQTSKTVTISSTDDDVFEAAETFTVTLSNPSNATISDDEATGTITNDDARPLISIDDVVLAEEDAGTTTFTFTITLTGDIGKDIEVNFITSAGTATPGSDFTPLAGSVTFSPGDTTKTLDIDVLGDATAESDETFFVSLSLATLGDAILVDGTGLGTITNDD